MTDVTLRIKNLSIALEAISHVNSLNSYDTFSRVHALLLDEIIKAKEENEKATQWPARSAKPTTDDDCPF